ncbi:MAG TPA: hypothetical protein VMN60_10060, partial [Longimicrobiales bacterium]|nr:hypothetical protein [Longimicrobiales bacterium]
EILGRKVSRQPGRNPTELAAAYLRGGVVLLRKLVLPVECTSLSLRVDNLMNELHRESTSRIKDFAPAAGRNIALAYRVHF